MLTSTLLTYHLTTVGLIYFFVFALYCIADVMTHSVYIVRLYFLGAILLALYSNSWIRVAFILLAVGWGGWKPWANVFLPVLLFYLPVWPVLLYGFGAKVKLIGRSDMLALASIACLYPWPATIAAILGVEVWRRRYKRRDRKSADEPVGFPALPGMFMGLAFYILAELVLYHFKIHLNY